MAKRRKAGVKAGTRRTTRRGKQAEGNNSLNEGASSTTSEPSSDLQSNAGLPIDATIPLSDVTDLQPEPAKDNLGHALCPTNIQPVVALHKKFGKYRCLFNNDDVFSRKYENCSDSETNSSVDIKVQDLCCGSESDSNTAVESRCEVSLHTNPESKHSLNENSQASNKEFNTLNESEILKDTHNYNEKLEEETNSDQVNKNENQIQNTSHDQVTESTMDLNNYEDDEVITIVQIVEDDNQDMYYDINIENANESNMHSEKSIEQDEMKKQNDIGKDFAKLNLLQDDSSPYSPTDRLMFDICNTEVQTLSRPDPCLTPSSTLSDDSNSSRATELIQAYSNDSSESSPTGVRRSSRIKTISNLKQKTKGYGLVKTPLKKALITQTKLKLEEISENQDKSSDGLLNNPPCLSPFPIPSEMPVKVKSRWRRSSELEMGTNSPAISPLASPSLPQKLPVLDENPPVEEEIPSEPLSKEAHDKIIEERMSQFQHLEENEYLCERMISKETKKMICDCFMTKEELERGELACGEDCLNRLLMIECNSRCPVGDRCTNRRFQKKQLGPLRVFYADKKGCGVEASGDISAGEFLMEYVGEVLDSEQFYKRAQAYSDENNLHHYFMSLKGDTVIDATLKGNISRFINHSCEPNAETQKWTVNGELRIGFFSKRDIPAGEEITFDYQFQRFGKEAQRCYCGAENCRGWIGAEPDSEDEEDEEDVSTSKLDATLSSEHDATSENAAAPRQITVKAKRERKYKSKKPELGLDADMEEELEALARTGVKNQSHTLRLSRTVVRARARRSQVALLRMLRDADLPCRRLFLDYRGLRLLAPWCSDAPLDFRYEMLLTVDRLPIPNKTMVHESRFFTIVEKWLSSSDIQTSEPVFIDEATGLPLELPNSEVIAEKAKENSTILQKVKDLSGQLLERWSNLKEVFKIPKKERIQQMKEHERQANVERRAADSSGSRDRDRDRDRREERDRDRDRDRRDERDRDRERERDRDRDRERERDRKRERERDRDRDRDDRDRRKRRSSPEGRRSIRLNERVLAAVPPMSKEERRRAFAEAAEAAEAARRAPAPPGPATPMPHPQHGWPPFWPQDFSQMFPQGMMGNAPNMMNGPNMMGGPQNMLGPMSGPMSNMPGMMSMPSEVPPEWIGPNGEYQGPPGFCPPFNGPQTFCMPQPNMMGMSSFGMGGFMFGQQMGPGFSAPPAPVTAPAPATATAPLPTSAPASAADVQMQEASAEVVLPSMWRSAVDERGRRYFYHVKLRQPQWEPPPPPPDESESEEEAEALSALDTAIIQRKVKGKLVEGVNGIYEVIKEDPRNGLIPDHALVNLKPRKRRPGLVTERPISPRTEEDKLAGRLEVKRYKQTKEKLRRRREKLLQRARRLAPQHLKFADLVDTDSASSGSEEAVSPDADEARRIKEQFRSGMARVMVQHLNPYRRADAPVARITSTADFKHLARKLTHFVMLKELKHCRSVEELVVTDSVRSKAKMFVKKYMMKFGPVYKPPPDEAD